MPARCHLELTPEETDALERARTRHRLASVRDRATAMLLIARGQSQGQVARTALATPTKQETIGTWVAWYREGGLEALEAHQHGGARRGCL